MFGLVIVIIGIAVFSLFMAAGSNYIDGDKLRASEVRAQLNTAASKYASGVLQFSLLFGKNPSDISHISPALIDPPKMPKNIGAVSVNQYVISPYGERTGICFSASNVEYSSYLAVSDLKDSLPQDQVLITSDCNDLTEISAPITYPATFNFIYIIRV